jgi:hypothetical protein
MKTLRLVKRLLTYIIGKPCTVCGLPMVWVRVERHEGNVIEEAYWCVKCKRYRLGKYGKKLWLKALRVPETRRQLVKKIKKSVHELECKLIPFPQWDDNKAWREVVPEGIQEEMFAEPPTASWGLGHDEDIGWYVLATQGQGGGIVWQEKELGQ